MDAPATSHGSEPDWWFDVTDLVSYFSQHARPSGIQRAALETIKAARDAGHPIRLATYHRAKNAFRELRLDDFDAALARPIPSNDPPRRSMVNLFPPGARHDIAGVLRHVRALGASTRRKLRKANWSILPSPPFSHPFGKGDIYLNLGTWWGHSEAALHGLASADVVIVSAVYDIIPTLFPEFTLGAHLFNGALPVILTISDAVLCFSESTERDVREFAKQTELRPPRLIRAHLGETHLAKESGTDGPAIGHEYVLMVGTIEVRKNHALAVRAWRQLLTSHRGRMPLLVFAGRWGWLTDDLREGLAESNYLNGFVRVFDHLADDELAALYRSARFTLFPSLYEGWGLPVAESLAYGKVCVAANNSSIPEAGRGLAVLFESDCRRSLIEAITPLLFDDSRLRQMERRIANEFVPVPWSRTWSDVQTAVAAAMAAPQKDQAYS